MAKGNDFVEVSIITGNDAEKKDMLVAQLSELGFESFEEEKLILKAFIPAKNYLESMLQPIMERYGVKYSSTVIEYKNWNELWESGFEPVVIEKFCAVRAGFHQPVSDVDFEIIITPKMSFGTGHHATTFLMIEAMKDISFKGKSVFDFGTGTGVLAILAEKLGASTIEAVDIDEWSIENGLENLTQNDSKKVNLYLSSQITKEKFDIILANINRNVILHNFQSIKSSLHAGGVLVLSGLLVDDAEVILMHAENNNLRLLSKKERNSWICMQFVNAED